MNYRWFTWRDTRAEMIWRSYRLYNSQIDEKDFEDDLNPLGFQLGQRKIR